jgi:acrylyl-CoA reductase (NADPH)
MRRPKAKDGRITGMANVPVSTTALVADSSGDETRLDVRPVPLSDLGPGDVFVAVTWSSVNYKDGLASIKKGRVARISPLVLGVDLAGTVVEPGGSGLAEGQPVVVHGYDLGVAHHGGFSQYARVPAEWVIPLPSGMTERQAMTLGTAGFTAALSVIALERHGLEPGAGPVLVTGATGGVGSAAVSMLAARGHQVTAVTGKADAHEWLLALGATDVVDRAAVSDTSRPLQQETWVGAVDCVGGDVLANVVSSLRYGAAVAASGNTAGASLSTTVFPFILRGVALLGIDSVQYPMNARRDVWQHLATDLMPPDLDRLAAEEVTLEGVPEALTRVLAGAARGRTLVRLV